MLGLSDFSVFISYILVFLLAFSCILYGILHWNKEGEISDEEIEEEKTWLKERAGNRGAGIININKVIIY